MALLRRVRGPLVLALLIACVYWKLLPPAPQSVWFDHYDMCQLKLPRLQFVAREFHQGRFPLWDPHLWAGQPVLGQGQAGALYPLDNFFLRLPLVNGAVAVETWNWWFVTLHYLAALFFYWLCRDRGLGLPASVLASVGFSCTGFLGSIPWLEIGSGVSWLPLVVLFLLRVWEDRRALPSAVLLGFCLGLAWLSGHHEVPMLTSYLAVGSGLMFFFWRRLRKGTWEWRPLGLTGMAVSLGALISAGQTLPLYEYGRLARRWVGVDQPLAWHEKVPYTVHEQYSLAWDGLLGLLTPLETPEFQVLMFSGLAITLLAVLGLRTQWTDRAVRFAAAAGIAGWVYVLGANTPLHRLLYEVLPGMDKARVPVRGLFLVNFAVCLMAGFGVEALLHRRVARRFAIGAAAALACLAAVAHLAFPVAAPGSPALVRAAAAAALVAAALLMPWVPRPDSSRWRQALPAAALLGAVLLEAGIVAGVRVAPLDAARSVCADSLLGHRQLVAELRREPTLGRVTVNREDVMTHLGDLHGIDELQGFVAAASENLLRHELHTARTQQLFGVTHHVGKEAAAEDDVQVGAYDSGVKLFRKAGALPRAWVVHRTMQVRGVSELRAAIQDPAIDLRRTALVLDPIPAVEECAAVEPVEIRRPGAGRVTLRINLECRGLVVLSDTYYPGWRAAVDGAPAKVHEVYGVFRGVVVEAGAHTIDMQYDPAVVKLGLGLSATGALLGLALLVAARRN